MNGKLEQKIKQLRSGDQRAFDYVYEQTNRSVYFAILYVVHDKMYAEDLMQETYVRAMRSLDAYTDGTNFNAWIARIGRNLALNHLKKMQREVTTDFETDSYKYGTEETQIPYIFDVAAKILPADEYEIVMMCQVAGYKRREVAEKLDMPIATVTWKNNQALKKLKNYLEKEGRE